MPLSRAAATADDAPFLDAMERRFAAAMAAFGAFEPAPLLAVAVSGGADSVALLRLAHDWAAARGGRVVAITFDHRLRPDSAAEAERVGAWCAALGTTHRSLAWSDPAPATGVEAAARAARYAALESVCRAEGALHLLVGHHAGDQRETVAMRMERGGGRGRAGMPALDARRDCRLLRPLLGFAKADLMALCRALGQAWVEDPSNLSDAFERNRVRKRLDRLPEAEAAAMDRAIAAAGAARMDAERRLARRMVSWVRLSPLGYAWVDWAAWRAAPRDDAADREFLARLAHCVGGRAYAPPTAMVERALSLLAAGKGATLGGCVARLGGGGLWILRENRAVPEAADGRWDDRFSVAPEHLADLRAPRGAAEREALRRALAALGTCEKPPPSAVFARVPVQMRGEEVSLAALGGYDPHAPAARFAPAAGATACAIWLAPIAPNLM